MKKLILFLLAIIATINIQAQRVFLEYNLGYGTFGMSEMRHTLLESESAVKGMQITDDFPGYLTQDAKIGVSLNRWDAGLQFGFLTTGGKKSLADYSGSYKNEIRNKGYKMGLFTRYCLLGADYNLKLYGQLSFGSIYTHSKLTDEIQLNSAGVHEKEEGKMHSMNLFLQPALVIQYQIIRPLAIQAQIGYEWSPYKGDMRIEGVSIPLKADWDGLRASIGLVVYLNN